MNTLCIVTTCRGRLAHLKQSLPHMVNQPGARCVVVDFSCPEGTADWVEANYPQVTVVRAEGEPFFNAGRARNLGAAKATEPWLCFADADAILVDNLAGAMRTHLKPNVFFRGAQKVRDATGLCICARADFEKIGGYDGVLKGYGFEDRDLYARLHLAGAEMHFLSPNAARMLPHDRALRTAHHEIKDLDLNQTVNHVYCSFKWDSLRLGATQMSEVDRHAVYENISKAVLHAHETGQTMRVTFLVRAQRTEVGRVLETNLSYTLGGMVEAAAQANLPVADAKSPA